MADGGGHWSRVVKVVERADLVIEVLDARFPNRTRNSDLENMVRDRGKQLLLLLNKADLVGKDRVEAMKAELSKEFPCLYLSAKEHEGSNRLREEIGKFTAGKAEARVGICGYPNTGKSSIINYLKGRNVAPSSIKAGFTKGEKFIKISETLFLIDTPGIIPYEESNESELALVGSKNPDQLSDPLGAVEYILDFVAKENPKAFENFYGVSIENKDVERILEEIAYRKRRLRVGGSPDLDVISRMVIMDWQKGRLKL